MLRKGFTLIELLIVITIIAILAGAAIPYVQDYVEDARISRAKADLDEIRNALVRYELDRGIAYTATGTSLLVGPYLDKAPIDPWGVPYFISATSSVAFSVGPNRDSNNPEVNGTAGTNGDDVPREFRAPLALSKAYWIDNDKSGTVNNNDTINLRFTRGALVADINALTNADLQILVKGAAAAGYTIAAGATATDTYTATSKEAVLYLSTVGTPFVPGRDTINIQVPANLTDSSYAPFGPNECATNSVVIQTF